MYVPVEAGACEFVSSAGQVVVNVDECCLEEKDECCDDDLERKTKHTATCSHTRVQHDDHFDYLVTDRDGNLTLCHDDSGDKVRGCGHVWACVRMNREMRRGRADKCARGCVR